MRSKEEIEKAKERLVKQAVTSSVGCEDYPNCICMKKDLKTLLQYIDQLEQENNKQSKMIDEMAKYIKEPYLINICKGRIQKITAIKQHFEKKVEK